LKYHLFLALFLTLGLSAAAETACPDKIQYQGGSYLKKGNDFYYRNGTYVLRSGNLYYPNGSYLKRDANIYYTNGSYLQKDKNLYYSNGSYLKRDGNYYYANGNYLKRDSTFYYENGSYARRNGVLYRPDGSVTAFPIQLSTAVDTIGHLFASVQAQTDYIDLDLRDLVVDDQGVHMHAIWTGDTFSTFEIRLNTGVVGEDVYVRLNGTVVTCSLDPGTPISPSFTLQSPAARVDVRVSPGFDPLVVRQALQTALDGLHLVK